MIKGDEQHPIGFEGEFMPWSSGLWSQFKEIFTSKFKEVTSLSSELTTSISLKEAIGELKYNVEMISAGGDVILQKNDTLNELPSPLGTLVSGKKPLICPISKNQQMTASEHFQDVRLIEFDTSAYGIHIFYHILNLF